MATAAARTSLSARQLNRATLGRQMLLGRESVNVVDAVQRVVALQAQEPASPFLALWNRVADLDPAALATAFAERTLVKATLMRLTLHVVHGDDYPYFHAAMLPNLRGPRLGDRRFTASGLSIAEADALLPHLASFTSQPRTGTEIEEMLAARLGERRQGVWWALRTYAPLHHAPTGGPWSFKRPASYLNARTTSAAQSRGDALQGLILRYLAAFGPASMPDIAQFTILRRSVVRDALGALGGRVETLTGPGGETLFDVPGGRRPAEDAVAPPRLLPMWDSILLAYADRSRVIPPEYRPVILRRNGDVLPTLLVDGYVAGVWRPVEGGIEATAFHRLTDDAWCGLAAEAAGLQAFLADRDPAVYRRSAHWWSKDLPSADVRILTR
ncbi:winged helix DNA-binding domain-containing protein [Micromonospora sp. KC606]|uniref:winged helix DNA-binding domain-containing protein n=1 Tax=Micromonospora sp. KC606 TaxID=2530379 RepID=UPI00104A09CA|nr:winged helix DNA-binding domain-containing protein [Micromonospora sp. KC606]TDC80228.1 winged helix DNA-binding domain-containing protein [Micromonospora sp. KC606]